MAPKAQDESVKSLKLKYRVHRSNNFGHYRTRTGNSFGPTPKRKASGLKSRKKAYGPF